MEEGASNKNYKGKDVAYFKFCIVPVICTLKTKLYDK